MSCVSVHLLCVLFQAGAVARIHYIHSAVREECDVGSRHFPQDSEDGHRVRLLKRPLQRGQVQVSRDGHKETCR